MPLSLVIDTGNIPITRPQTDVLMDNWDACATQRAQMALSAITECSPQLRRLDLIASGRDLDLTSELFDIGVPNLECLTVWLPCFRFKSHFEHLGPLSRPGSSLPPRLKALAVSQTNGWLPMNNFTSLTHLCVSFDTFRPCFLDHVCKMLERMPNLLSLHIAYANLKQRMFVTNTDPLQPTVLKKLQHLTFSDCSHQENVENAFRCFSMLFNTFSSFPK